MALKQLAIPPTPLISLPDSISICSDQAGALCKIATVTEVQLGGARERGRKKSHKSLCRTPNNKGMSCSVRQGLALAAEEDAQRFRRLINLRAAGKRLPAFYSRTPQAPSSPSPLARPGPNPSCSVRPLRSRCFRPFPIFPRRPHTFTPSSPDSAKRRK